MRLNPSLSFGNKKDTNPNTHCKPNSTTAAKPIHECKLYMLGIGFDALLWESKTAFNAIEANIKTAMWIKPWSIFTYSFVVVRSNLYTSIAFFLKTANITLFNYINMMIFEKAYHLRIKISSR
jgi:hypothetical protein